MIRRFKSSESSVKGETLLIAFGACILVVVIVLVSFFPMTWKLKDDRYIKTLEMRVAELEKKSCVTPPTPTPVVPADDDTQRIRKEQLLSELRKIETSYSDRVKSMEQRIDVLQSQLNTMQRIAEREQEPKKPAAVRPDKLSRPEKEKPVQRKIVNKGMDVKQKYGGTLKRETKKTGPAYHVVRQGDTFYSICRSYGISLQKLGELNHFDEKAEIYPGQKIIVGP